MEHHVCSSACQAAQKERGVQGPFNLSIYESKELARPKCDPQDTCRTPCAQPKKPDRQEATLSVHQHDTTEKLIRTCKPFNDFCSAKGRHRSCRPWFPSKTSTKNMLRYLFRGITRHLKGRIASGTHRREKPRYLSLLPKQECPSRCRKLNLRYLHWRETPRYLSLLPNRSVLHTVDEQNLRHLHWRETPRYLSLLPNRIVRKACE